MIDSLQNASPVVGRKDEWKWKGRGGRCFTVKAVFTELVDRRRVAAPGCNLTALAKINFRSIWRDQA